MSTDERPVSVIPSATSSSTTSRNEPDALATTAAAKPFVDEGPKIGWAEAFKDLAVRQPKLLQPLLDAAIKGDHIDPEDVTPEALKTLKGFRDVIKDMIRRGMTLDQIQAASPAKPFERQ